MNRKRILAIIGLVIMGILIVGAIILAIVGTELALKLLMADLFCLIVVPALIYGYQIFFRAVNRKNKDGSNEP